MVEERRKKERKTNENNKGAKKNYKTAYVVYSQVKSLIVCVSCVYSLNLLRKVKEEEGVQSRKKWYTVLAIMHYGYRVFLE